MQPFRIVDRTLGSGGGQSKPAPDRSNKPGISDLRAFYWSGPGFEEALKEAKDLIDTGSTIKQAAKEVGWTEKELSDTLKGSGPTKEWIEEPVVRKVRPKRTLDGRVKGLGPVPDKLLKRIKQLYNIQLCTIKEISVILKMPYEKIYLAARKAGVRFRRPGRRANKF